MIPSAGRACSRATAWSDVYASRAPSGTSRTTADALALLCSRPEAPGPLTAGFHLLQVTPATEEDFAEYEACSQQDDNSGCEYPFDRLTRDAGNRARLLEEHAEAAAPGGPGTGPEDLATLRALLVRLPAELGQIAVHYYIDGMSQQEIADVIGCSRRRIGGLLEQLPGHAQAGHAQEDR